jgi:hypothetical protein
MTTYYRGAKVNPAQNKDSAMESGVYRGRRWTKQQQDALTSPKTTHGVYRGVKWGN